MLAPLAEAVSALARSPFWQFDIKQHTGRVSSLSFAPASVPGEGLMSRAQRQKDSLHASIIHHLCSACRDHNRLLLAAMQQWVLIRLC